ncbi:hypothetical protein [Sinorhizobium sp. A49]|uniref:hypothetical protein n=1 Tax=Sinorhizobium sp. A49 TaxID=1945861 RepID=UPI001115AB35|nr:hypothetical protein [Sinorhizobium sp. A49]
MRKIQSALSLLTNHCDAPGVKRFRFTVSHPALFCFAATFCSAKPANSALYDEKRVLQKLRALDETTKIKGISKALWEEN